MGSGDGNHEFEDRRAADWNQSPLSVREPWSDRRPHLSPQHTMPARRDAERAGQCVWAAEIGGRLVGLIGMVPSGEHIARIQWFRIEPDWQHTTVLAKLIGQLYEHCCRQGYVRVVLDAHVAPQWIWRLFVRRGFRLLRRIRGPHSEVLQFALDPHEQTQGAAIPGREERRPETETT